MKWLRSAADDPQPSLAALAQLNAVGFAQMPTSYAVLTWTSPTGRALPIAYVSEHLTGARDGWTWCVDLAVDRRADGRAIRGRATSRPPRRGRRRAARRPGHAQPRVPRPVQPAGAGRVQRWHDGAFAMLDERLTVPDPESLSVVRARADAIAARFDDVLGDDRDPGRDTGAAHPRRPARRPDPALSEGLAIIDFDGNPVAPTGGGVLHPAARDVAQLLCSLDHVGQIVRLRHPDAGPAASVDWLAACRGASFLDAYRTTLQDSGWRFCWTSGCSRRSSSSRSSVSWCTPTVTCRAGPTRRGQPASCRDGPA